jgi:hypothetical protein
MVARVVTVAFQGVEARRVGMALTFCHRPLEIVTSPSLPSFGGPGVFVEQASSPDAASALIPYERFCISGVA